MDRWFCRGMLMLREQHRMPSTYSEQSNLLQTNRSVDTIQVCVFLRWSRFEHLVSSALLHPFNLQQRHSSAECQRAVPDATVTDETDANRDACKGSLDLGEPSIEVVEAECRRLLSHFEAG